MALLLIFILYHLNFKSVTATLFIMLAMPFTAIGGILGIKLLGFNMSIAVWAGMIEVIGIGAALCALVMTFLNEAYGRWQSEGKIKSSSDIRALSLEGAIRSLRPALMTCSADVLGLMPALWATGIGAEFLKRCTAPIIFGLFSAVILALIAIPTFYVMWKEWELTKKLNPVETPRAGPGGPARLRRRPIDERPSNPGSAEPLTAGGTIHRGHRGPACDAEGYAYAVNSVRGRPLLPQGFQDILSVTIGPAVDF